MSEKTKGAIYKLITIVCIVICLLLIGRVAADELVGKHAPEHVPIVRPTAAATMAAQPITRDAVVIDEELIADRLGGYMMQELPLRRVGVEISESGRITLTCSCPRQKLLSYLDRRDELPDAFGLLARLLPGTIDLSLTADCTCDEDSRLIAAAPITARIGSVTAELGSLPQSLFSELTLAINKLLLDEGQAFSQIVFTDGAIILKP